VTGKVINTRPTIYQGPFCGEVVNGKFRQHNIIVFIYYILTMVQYSVKKSRGRKIKKYRKSRRGKGRGKINLKCGKTRRYKVFKNTRRRTLGKRKGRGRWMMGGLTEWREYGNFFNDLMKDYINAKYKDKIIKYTKQDTTTPGFSKLEQMCNKVVMITNKSKGRFLREENQLQRLLVYSCHRNGGQRVMMEGGGQSDPIFCYALVRVPDLLYQNVNKDNGPPIVGMNDKILFISPELGSVINIDMNSGLTKQEQYETLESCKKNLLQSMIKKYTKLQPDLIKIKNMTYEEFCNLFRCYEFKSFISSSGDKYRIFMSVDHSIPNSMQCSLFDTLSETQKQLPEPPEQHDGEQSIPNIGPDEAMIHEDHNQQVDAE
jgi:hypothetical protein